jgi:hypothetical protein
VPPKLVLILAAEEEAEEEVEEEVDVETGAEVVETEGKAGVELVWEGEAEAEADEEAEAEAEADEEEVEAEAGRITLSDSKYCWHMASPHIAIMPAVMELVV